MPLRTRSFLPAVLAGALLLLAAPARADDCGSATVTVVHGVPGATVDVYVNGAVALASFAPGTVTGPLHLPAGTYDLAIRPAGAPATADTLAELTGAVLEAGANLSVVARLNPVSGEKPALLTPFANDVERAGQGHGRVVVRHAALAPEVDVRLYRRHGLVGTLAGLVNGSEAAVDVPAGHYRADIAPAGTPSAVFGPVPVRVDEQRSTVVYAYGDLAGGTFAVQTLPLTGTQAHASVVHGIPGAVVDVYVNGDLLLDDFTFRTITGELSLPRGTYDIRITPGDDASVEILSASPCLEAGDNVAIVAHLDASGQPALSVFANDVRPLDGPRARLAVRHAAFAPAVDALFWRKLFHRWYVPMARLCGLDNGGEATLRAFAGRYLALVTLAGSRTQVMVPAPLTLEAGTLSAVYVVGPNESGQYEPLVQVLPLR